MLWALAADASRNLRCSLEMTIDSAVGGTRDFGATAGVTLLHARHVLRRMQHVLLLLMGLFLFFWKGTAASQMS